MKVNKELAKKILEMHNKGYSYNKIALELGISPMTAYNTIKKIRLFGEEYLKKLEEKSTTDKRTRAYFRVAKCLIKKIPKNLAKKILNEAIG
jgi:transposase